MLPKRTLRQVLALALTAVLAMLITGCGNDNFAKNDAQSKAPMGKVTIVGQQFTEAQIMTALYELLLRDAGYQTAVKNFSTRDVYLPVLEKGQVQVSADYLSSFTEALNRNANGPDAQPVSSPDPEATLEVLKSLAAPRGVTPLEPAQAQNANAYAVTAKYAETHRLRTLSDLAALGQPIALAANSDCSTRQDCAKGLKEVYGIEISKIEPLGFGSAETKRALTDGQVELAQVSSTDGTL
ncbi:MAG TPA: glycine betaine ABC transporter substrate-binding protein, partial [Marmoricola sp.]|nr:glycine betaine ABC transporter substrate-binding protein [Marmoricola sp.]